MIKNHRTYKYISRTISKNIFLPEASHYNDALMDGVSNHQPHQCLLSRLFGCRSKKTSKLCVTGLCVYRGPVNSPHKGPVTRKMFPFDDVIMHCMYQRPGWPLVLAKVWTNAALLSNGSLETIFIKLKSKCNTKRSTDWFIMDSGNGLVSIRRQAIIRTNADLPSIWSLEMILWNLNQNTEKKRCPF